MYVDVQMGSTHTVMLMVIMAGMMHVMSQNMFLPVVISFSGEN